MQNAVSTATGSAGAIARWRQSEKAKALLQLLLLLGVGAVGALMKRVEPSLGIPGSSGPLWLGTLVAGRAIVRRDGAGTVAGAALAVWGIPVGLNGGFTHNLALYGITGVALDVVARLPRMSPRGLLGALACGASSHMVKFSFIVSAAYGTSLTKHFMVVGLLRSALLHLGFGILAGLAGWGAYRLWHRGKAWD